MLDRMGLAGSGAGFDHGMPIMRNFPQDLRSRIYYTSHGSAFCLSEDRANQAKAANHYSLHFLDGRWLESPCIANGAIVGTTTGIFVIADFTDCIQRVSLTSTLKLLLHSLDSFDGKE